MIHSSAIVHPSARIDPSVEIGPWTLIGPEVSIDADTWIAPHVVINGPSKIGKANKIFQFASVGEDPQDKKYNGERTCLEIGDNNSLREYCSIHRGTAQGCSKTSIGNNNLFMANCHVAHDCLIGDHTIVANSVAIAGHVNVQDYAILGGLVGVHQFCSVGAHSFVGVGTVVVKDVPPFFMVSGNDAKAYGLNSEGLKRRGFSSKTLSTLKNAYKVLYHQGLTVKQAIGLLQQMPQSRAIKLLIDFVQNSQRGIIR